MKRDARGNPIATVHRWSRPPLSCQACREKKRRCDRAQPCSNCVLRNIPCEYSGQSPDILSGPESSQGPISTTTSHVAAMRPTNWSEPTPKLEAAFLENSNQLQGPGVKPQGNFPISNPSSDQNTVFHYVTPFSAHHMSSNERVSDSPGIIEIARELPPLRQAKELFNHFAVTLQPTYGVLHIPSSRIMMEKVYECIVEGEVPQAADLMLLFSIFAGAALAWTTTLLEKLNATSEGAQAALTAYSRLAFVILDHPSRIIQPSTTALVAMGTLGHILMNTDGFPSRVQTLRHYCLLMSRELKIHRLDTAKAREERRLKGCDMIDVEVQRRAWWNMVASDCRLMSFCGGPQEGAYIFQPKHMNVSIPSNTDDEFVTSAGIQQEFPMSVPTSMSAFITRVQGADLCRQVIDALPSILLDSQEPDYSTILELDTKIHDHIASLPVYFQLDPESIEQSRQTCKERPYIAWQRISVHFSIHTRLCRLHRPYHLEGITNPKYAYSHVACIRSAHKVLELRRAMDEVAPEVGLKAARFWTVMHHVFFAALILAIDVSFNPSAPDAEARKAQVINAYETLEQSKRESNNLMEGIQKNLQTLMSTLHKERSQTSSIPKNAAAREGLVATGFSTGDRSAKEAEPVNAHESTFSAPPSLIAADGGSLLNDLGKDDWEKLWTDFVAVAPDLDVLQWNALLEDVDFTPHLEIF
ncbi:hypothetical protein N7490_004692 [Penicillium lividum]|nr:hypothetical protein N7490_004692 [Penicillium lividum]